MPSLLTKQDVYRKLGGKELAKKFNATIEEFAYSGYEADLLTYDETYDWYKNENVMAKVNNAAASISGTLEVLVWNDMLPYHEEHFLTKVNAVIQYVIDNCSSSSSSSTSSSSSSSYEEEWSSSSSSSSTSSSSSSSAA